jgi:uridine phosphorylase
MENKERGYHIGLSIEDIENAKYAILPGDPGRVSKIARMLDNYKPLAVNREFTSYLGEINNNKVLVISTGIGGPSTAICVEELNMIGIKNIIRVGTCGGMNKNVDGGDLIIANSAIRDEGTSRAYAPSDYPAVANIDMVNALKYSANKLGYKYHVGIVHTKDSFYGQHDPDSMLTATELKSKWESFINDGALGSDMETATLYVVARIRGIRAVSVLTALWNQEKENIELKRPSFDTENAIKVSIEAIRLLINKEN